MFQYEQILSMIKQGYNPQQLVLTMLENNMKGTPLGDNLINLARKGDTASIEQIARNLTQQRGGDFDKEFEEFKRRMGL